MAEQQIGASLVERTTPFARTFVFPAVSATCLPINPWTDASSPESPPADTGGLKLSPSHRQSSLLARAHAFLDRATGNDSFAGGVDSGLKVTHRLCHPNPVSSEEEKSYELSNKLL